jgi:hypothetical protein
VHPKSAAGVLVELVQVPVTWATAIENALNVYFAIHPKYIILG